MTTNRTPINRHRKPLLLADPETIKLFARLERVPVPHRMGYAYREHAHDLAKRLGVHSEHWLDGISLNDPELFRRPPEYDFRRAAWERVLATRKQLLELAGLPPDGSHDVEPFDVDYDYDDAHDFADLSPPPPKPAKRPSRKAEPAP